MVRVAFTLPPEAIQALGRPVVGQGGFQSLLRQIQALLVGNELTLTPELIGRIVGMFRTRAAADSKAGSTPY